MQENKLIWDFEEKIEAPTDIAALKIKLLNAAGTEDNPNGILVRIPKGGKCIFCPAERKFIIYDTQDQIYKQIYTPPTALMEVSYIDTESLTIIQLADPGYEYYRETLN